MEFFTAQVLMGANENFLFTHQILHGAVHGLKTFIRFLNDAVLQVSNLATTLRSEDLETKIADIIAKHREIQFVTDAEWLRANLANAGTCKEFQLPTDRVMK